MTPHEFVYTLLQPHIEKVGAKRLSEDLDVSESVVRYTVMEGKARPDTLLKIVEKLSGTSGYINFLNDFRDQLPGIDIEKFILQKQKEAIAKSKDHERLTGQRKAQEVLMHTGSRHGIDFEELCRIVSQRKNTIDQLVEEGILKVKNGRAYSSAISSDPMQAIRTMNLKTEIISQSDDRFRIGKTLTDDDRISLTGCSKLYELIAEFVDNYKSVIEEYSEPDGVTITMGIFLSSLGLTKEQKAEFDTIGVAK